MADCICSRADTSWYLREKPSKRVQESVGATDHVNEWPEKRLPGFRAAVVTEPSMVSVGRKSFLAMPTEAAAAASSISASTMSGRRLSRSAGTPAEISVFQLGSGPGWASILAASGGNSPTSMPREFIEACIELSSIGIEAAVE